MRRGLRWLGAALRGHGAESASSPNPSDRLRLADALETLDEALVVTDPAFAILQWNAAMERLSGLPRAAALGRKVHRLLPFFDAIGLPQHLRRALSGEVRFSAEVPHRDGTGTTWVEARCVPLTDERGRVTGVAAFLADTTERNRRAIFARALETIGRSLTSSLDLNEVLDTIASKAMEVMAAQSAIVVSWEGEDREFRVLRAVGRTSAEYASGGSIPFSGGPISRAVLEGRIVTTPNILSDVDVWLTPDRRAQIEREGFKAVAAAPLLSKQRVHGALAVHYWTERKFTEDEVYALSLMGEQAALAIDNARLYAVATSHADRLRELAEVERVVASSLDVDVVLQRIADATARLVGAPVVHLWSAEPGARVLELRAASVAPDMPPVVMPTFFAFGDGISGLAAERRELVYVHDARQDPRVRAIGWEREAGLGSVLAVPMVTGETLIGVLTVRARLGTLAALEDQALVTSLAARAALAIQNARAYRDAVRRASHLGALATLSQSITVSLDTAVLMDRIVHTAASMRPGALAAAHVYDADTETLRFGGCSGDVLRELPDERDARHGLPGLVFDRRAPVLVPEPLTHAATLAPSWWRDRPRASYYGVPILVGDSFVGVLDYIVPDGVPDPEEQETLRLLAAQAGIAVRNAALYQAERAEAQRASALAAVAQRISRALDLDELLAMIAESAVALTGVRFASFWLADEERRTLTLRRAARLSTPVELPHDRVSYDFGAVGLVARTRQPLVVDDVFAEDLDVDRDWWRACGFTSFAGYPILAGDELLAVLVLIDDEAVRFNAKTREVITMFIAQASVAINNARLYREAQRRREVAEALARIGREVSSTLDVQRIAELIARGVVELLEGNGSIVFRYEAETRTLHAIGSFGEDASAVKGVVLESGEGAAGRAVTERRIVSTSDILNEPGFHLSSELRERIEHRLYRSVLSVPLVARDRVVGALAMGAEVGRVFTREEQAVLQAFADQAALAFENAQLYASARYSLARLRETQAQLLQAGKMSALGQLVSGVAHELNNPLSVIIGYGQLMLHREIPETLRRPVELMVTQGDRMAKIVRNLLYFARQRPPERVAVNVHHVIEQTLALRQNQLTLSGIAVERDFAEELPTVVGDAQQLQQVFLNLTLNAEQAIAAENQGGRLVFRTRVVDERWVRTEVTDNGPGIPADVLPRVFEPFFTTKEVGSGTGLGLSVSYGIIEEHGGRLTADSVPGRTVFTLDLPMAEAPVARPTAIVEASPFSGKGRYALVVEDEPGVAELVVTLLRDNDWKVDLASGGRGALERVRQQPYDLIVSDIRMADGDGEEFYRSATAEHPALAARFIFVTGDTANVAAWAFLKAANVTVLEKPFRPEIFLDAVRRVASALTASGSPA